MKRSSKEKNYVAKGRAINLGKRGEVSHPTLDDFLGNSNDKSILKRCYKKQPKKKMKMIICDFKQVWLNSGSRYRGAVKDLITQ